MNRTNQIKVFAAVVFYLLITNLLINNGVIEFWDVESNHLKISAESGAPQNLPSLILSELIQITTDKFLLRIPGILILLLSFYGIYNLGKRVFGQETILYTLLVLATSLLTLNLAKFSTSDIWLFSGHTLTVLSLILYIKQPIQKWKMTGLAAVTLGCLINPLSTFLLLLITGFFLYFLHPNGKRINDLVLWNLPVLAGFILSFFGIFLYESSATEFMNQSQINIFKYLIIIFLGILPWFTFFPSALWNMAKRFKQREELAIITFCWTIGSIFSFSAASQVVFALIIAKQIQGFFDKNYPYENMVKSSALMHLGVILFGAIYLIMISWENLKGAGFRAAMMTTLFYWIGCLISFIGLYGKNKKMIVGGLSIAGLLASYFFWTKAFPTFFG